MRTVIVTGAAGFIGCRTSTALLNKGYRVVGIDNVNNYYDVRLKEYRINKLKKEENFVFNKLDIENKPALENLIDKYEIESIINLAARAGVRYSVENPYIYISTNVIGTLNILEIMKKYKIKKLVLASTSSLYAGQKIPFNENLSVNTPISPYAASKKSAEMLAYTYNYLFDIDITVVRYFTVFGPAGRPDMSIFRFIKWIDEETEIQLFGDGTQTRDFTYVDDIAEGTINALKPLGYQIINLGGGRQPKSMMYIINKIEEYLDRKARIRYLPFQKEDIIETRADISKAEKLLQWKPKISIEEGLRKTVAWYKDNKNWLKDISI